MSESSVKTNLVYSQQAVDDFGHNFQLLTAEKIADIAAAIEAAKENQTFLVPGYARTIPPRSLAKAITFLHLSHLAAVIELSKEDKVIKVESGITVDDLNKLLAQDNLWFPVSPAKSNTTLFDVINEGNGGVLEQGFGGPKKLVLGLDVILANGNAITCGGRVVKNVTGYDLTKLFIGAKATLGVVTSAYLRLSALPKATKTLVFEFKSANDAFTFANQIARHNLPISCLELLWAKLALKVISSMKDTATVALAFVEIYGQEEQIEEVGKEITGLAEPTQATVLDHKQAKEVWSNIAGLTTKYNLDFLNIKNKQSSLCRITDTLAADYWQARPNCRRLTAYASSQEEIAAMVENLISNREEAKETFEIAYANNEFEYKVETIAKNDPNLLNLLSLRAQIKSRFDPNNIFNPLVSL